MYHREPTTKMWKTEKLKSKKTDMLRSISKQLVESMESVLKKTVLLGRFKPAYFLAAVGCICL